MGDLRQRCVDVLWAGNDPFASFPSNLYAVDTQGWNTQHHYLPEVFFGRTPRIIMEIGVWKGGTSLLLASQLRQHAVDGVVISIDTWLGSAEHWLNPPWFADLACQNGRPTLQLKFMSNVVHHGLTDYIVPLPLDSVNAATLIAHYGIPADVIHLDAAHDYQSVLTDLKSWWPILREGGILIGDDYHPHTHWQGVRQAFDDFFGPLGLLPLENVAGKCRLVKPSGRG